MHLTPLNFPLPFCTSNKTEVLKNKHVHRNKKKVFRAGQAWADKFVLARKRGLPGFFFTYILPSIRLSLEKSGPRKLKFEGFAHFFLIFWPIPLEPKIRQIFHIHH
jgi:hypothetical protein